VTLEEKKMPSAWRLAAGVTILYWCSAPAYADNIYQCASKDGAEVLQNMPCQSGSEVWVQKDGGDAKSAPLRRGVTPVATQSASRYEPDAAASDAAVVDAQDPQSAKTDASAVPGDTAAADSDASANLPSEPVLGMSQQQVRAILGAPTAISREEVVQGTEVTWTYGDSRVVQFDANGRLSKK
jgi:hypothetical protein